MMKKRNEETKRLVIETLQFLIKRRNIALFRLNALRKFGTPEQIAMGEQIVHNLRLRFIFEINTHKNLLTEAEKSNFFHDGSDDLQ